MANDVREVNSEVQEKQEKKKSFSLSLIVNII